MDVLERARAWSRDAKLPSSWLQHSVRCEERESGRTFRLSVVVVVVARRSPRLRNDALRSSSTTLDPPAKPMLASARALRALPRTRPLAAARRAPALARPFTAATPRLEPLNGGSASYAEAMLEEWKQVRTLSSHSRPPSSRRRPRLPRARSEKAGPRRERERPPD